MHEWDYMGQRYIYIWRITCRCTHHECKGKISSSTYITLSVTVSLLPMWAESQFVGRCTLHLSCSHTGQISRCPCWSKMILSMFDRMMPHVKNLLEVQVPNVKSAVFLLILVISVNEPLNSLFIYSIIYLQYNEHAFLLHALSGLP